MSDKTIRKSSSRHQQNRDHQPAETGSHHRRFWDFVSHRNYEKAFQYLHANGSGSSCQNDKGVCLMRMGRHHEAVQIFRRLVLKSDNISMQDDCPTVYKINLATALLLNEHPSGCVALLSQIEEHNLPSVLKLRAILQNWEKTMSVWQRLNWRWLGVEPSNCPIKLIGEVGEVGEVGDFDAVMVTRNATPTPDSPSASFKAAV